MSATLTIGLGGLLLTILLIVVIIVRLMALKQSDESHQDKAHFIEVIGAIAFTCFVSSFILTILGLISA